MTTTVTPESRASFRDAMRRLAATVTIVSARHGEQRHGITATAVTSLSFDPPSLLTCINRTSSLYPLISQTDRFCVNLLTSEQAALSDRFAGRLTSEERFLHGNWQENEVGVPFLDGGQASIFCIKRDTISYGSHAIFIGDVENVRISEDVSSLLYSNGGYGRCAPLHAAV